ncbi:4'-phosphopantetheinyl transferase family protein [Streptomyces sp. NPDC051041]|uniref:4'-phosphopantetheinyl transferase family protein n=1 Tax=Streptomyces sp. NPDC051041 TaxID=3365640 RepID=UPI003794F15D
MSPRLASRRITVVVTPTPGLDDAASRTALLTATARVLGMAPDGLRLGHEPGGRPLLTGLGDDVRVSLSHGRGVAALALTDLGPVGVDVEVPRPVAAQRLADRWFGGAEADWLRSRPGHARDLAFFWLWTHKEAMGKACGTGLARGGLERPGPLPRHWPPPYAPVHRLRPLSRPAGRPDRAGLAVAAPLVGPGAVLAVAALGPRACGAPVDVRLCPAPHGRSGSGRPAGGAGTEDACHAASARATHPSRRELPT